VIWASKLFKNLGFKFNPLISKKARYVYVDSLVDAVFRKRGNINATNNSEQEVEKAQACAFRELLEECEKQKKVNK